MRQVVKINETLTLVGPCAFYFLFSFPSRVPLPAVGRVPLLRRPHRTLRFPRAALHGCGHLQRAPHISHLPHHQVGKANEHPEACGQT